MAVTLFAKPKPALEKDRSKPKGSNAPSKVNPLDQVQGCYWRDVYLPLTSISVSAEHTLVEHEYFGVDLADVEATGRKSTVYRLVMPFVNGIAKGKQENWTSGRLYPDGFNAFLRAFVNDRTTGTLNHPEHGQRRCKPHTIEYTHDAQLRDGVIVTATWKETLDPSTSLDGTLGTTESKVTELRQHAINMDVEHRNMQSLIAGYQPEFQESFESLVNKITGFFEKTTTAATLAANRPTQILSRLKRVEKALKNARIPQLWPVQDAIDKLRDAALNALNGGPPKTTGRYTTKERATLAGLASQLGNSIADLIKLNPGLLSNPVVQPNVTVLFKR